MSKLLAAVVALLASAPALACEGLVVSEAWIREAPPGAMSVAYARLANRGSQPVTLEGARSAAFGGAGLHRTVVDASGMSRMRAGTLTIAPGAGAALEPGGWHLMLYDPARLLKAGDVVEVTLVCSVGERTFPFTVKAPE